ADRSRGRFAQPQQPAARGDHVLLPQRAVTKRRRTERRSQQRRQLSRRQLSRRQLSRRPLSPRRRRNHPPPPRGPARPRRGTPADRPRQAPAGPYPEPSAAAPSPPRAPPPRSAPRPPCGPSQPASHISLPCPLCHHGARAACRVASRGFPILTKGHQCFPCLRRAPPGASPAAAPSVSILFSL